MFFDRFGKKTENDPKQEKSNLDGPECPHCGNIGRAGAIYCDQCGIRIKMNPKPNCDTVITQELPREN